MRKYFVVLAVLGCLAMTGCVAVGKDFPENKIDQLVLTKKIAVFKKH